MTTPANAAAADTPTPVTRRSAWRRAGRILLWLLAALITLVLMLGAAAWWWSGTPQSLGTTLGFAARYMPAGQSLETSGTEGSLRGGGRIGSLRWQSPSLGVEVSDLQVAWQLRPLLDRKLQLDHLSAAMVSITPQGPGDDKPLEPLTGIVLPIEVDLPFDIGEIRWAGKPDATVKALRGHYRYADNHHRLQLDGVDVAQGHYSGNVKLQGPAPMAIEARLNGRVEAPMPQGTAPLAVLADANVKGNLAHADARLHISAHVALDAGQAPVDAMRANVDADIAPWAPQPVIEAKGDFAQIDAARFWPGAPQTRLSGTLRAGPVANAGSAAGAATVWQAHVTTSNASPGPWNAQKLPITRLDATARFDGQRWEFPKSTVNVGDGEVSAQGSWSPAPAPWQVDATVRKLQPALLYTGLDAAPVSGSVKATQRDTTLAFDVDLKADAGQALRAARGDLMQGFRVDVVTAKGQWRDRTLDLNTLRIESGSARVAGHLRAQIDTRSGEGQLELVAPGGNARVEGQMAPVRGDAQVRVGIQDAAALQRWAESLPGLSTAFAGMSVRGTTQLEARLQGGWTVWQQQLATPATPVAGLHVQAMLQTPQFELQLPARMAAAAATSVNAGAQAASLPAPAAAATAAGPTRVQLRNVRVDVAGSPANATLSVDGDGTLGKQHLQLSTRASVGIAAPSQWHVALASLRAQFNDTQAKAAAPWALQLDSPLDATVTRSNASANGAAAWRLDASGASASVSGPAPGTVRLEWQPLSLSQFVAPGPDASASYRLRSKGKLLGLPMGWAEALGANFDLQQRADVTGDLVFDGDWDIDAGEALRATARLQRRSGDIRVRAGESAQIRRIHSEGTGTLSETRFDGGRRADAPATPAGLRQAELTLNAQGDTVRAQFTWDSERAGQVTADLRTSVVQRDGGWSWPEAAPLAGRVQAHIPNIGVWSMLAPPAWRIDGTLAANAALSGARAAPQWNGSLSADGLAIKAAVEGVELRDGKLRATLSGNRLAIDEFTLTGGSASRVRIAGPSGNLSTLSAEAAQDGGELKASGEVSWGAASFDSSGIQMALSVRLRALRVLVRSDRQVTVSGQVQAGLDKGQFNIRGVLKTDRGVIILPDETAPTLGSDVVIRSAAIDREAEAARARAASSANATAAREGTPNPRKTPDIAVTVDMGDDFAVQGHGLTTRLGGQIEVRSNAASGGQPQVTGEIHTVSGRYRAYGQQLDVDSGIARFNGPYDNPSLDILAIRPNLDQRAGVRITGTAQSPRVALYSQPQVTDAETLSWMMLGRSTAGGGAETILMQQAALALLGGFGPKGGGGNFASRFGLDEIGFKGPATGQDLRSSAITLGKRLSNQVYVTYEASLAGALGTLYVFYDLSRHLALRGQAGSRGAIDLIYTVTYD